MDAPAPGRIAVMSIHAQHAESILEGVKRVEFRKRRLASDISTVLLYSTLPVGRVVGAFRIGGYDVMSPSALWENHKSHAGITREALGAYYRGKDTGVGIRIAESRRCTRHVELSEVRPSLRAPQSFAYVSVPLGSDLDSMLREVGIPRW